MDAETLDRLVTRRLILTARRRRFCKLARHAEPETRRHLAALYLVARNEQHAITERLYANRQYATARPKPPKPIPDWVTEALR